MKWQSLFLTCILIAVVLVAGCTEEVPPGPAPDVINIQPGQVLYTTGEVTGDGIAGGTIDTITFTIGLAPGEKPVNMENLSIVYADAIRTETLAMVNGSRGNDPPAGFWSVVKVTDEIGMPNNRLSDKELFVIRINPKAPLVPRQLISIVVKPPSGPTLTLRRVSPPSILKENNILGPL